MYRAVTGVAGAAALMAAVTLGGIASTTAEPADYGALPVNPNDVTDSTAWIAEAPVLNPHGQTGVQAVYNHRDGTRQVTDSITVFGDSQGAANAMAQGRSTLAGEIINATTHPAPVGTDGMITTGVSPDNTRSVTALTFTEGSIFTLVEFEGPLQDPVPVDLATRYGQAQVGAIQAGL